MKKAKIILALLAILPFSGAFAQMGEIIYRDFDPDSVMILYSEKTEMSIDLDGEGHSDIRMYWEPYTSGTLYGIYCYIYSCYNDSIKICPAGPDCIMTEVEEWYSFLDFRVTSFYDRYGFRVKHGNGYLYGWFELFTRGSQETYWEWGFDRVAFCTILDYPLRWGQTEIVGVKENNESITFANVYPNPTTGMVTITGEKLKQAEVFNMLGQQMLSTKGEGKELQIDMTALPAGVYFVTVTDEEGRKCMRKVVKE